jgi:hypothetical protein
MSQAIVYVDEQPWHEDYDFHLDKIAMVDW